MRSAAAADRGNKKERAPGGTHSQKPIGSNPIVMRCPLWTGRPSSGCPSTSMADPANIAILRGHASGRRRAFSQPDGIPHPSQLRQIAPEASGFPVDDRDRPGAREHAEPQASHFGSAPEQNRRRADILADLTPFVRPDRVAPRPRGCRLTVPSDSLTRVQHSRRENFFSVVRVGLHMSAVPRSFRSWKISSSMAHRGEGSRRSDASRPCSWMARACSTTSMCGCSTTSSIA